MSLTSVESRVFPGKKPPFGVQKSGGAQNRPEMVYEDDGKWPDLNLPLKAAVRIDRNVLNREESREKDAGGMTADGLHDFSYQSHEDKLNGVYMESCKDFELSGLDIHMDGYGENDFACVGAGVLAKHDSNIVLKDSTIHMGGCGRSCTIVTSGSTAVIKNCTLISDGGPLPEGYVPRIGFGMLEPPKPLQIGGTARCHLSTDNSRTYFYDCELLVDGWAAFSTDAALGYVYLEANHCTAKVSGKGYGAYSDGECHVFLNNCEFETNTHTVILAGDSELTFNNCRAVAGTNCALLHNVHGIDTELAQLIIHGGRFEVGEDFAVMRSCNTYIDMVGADIVTKNGVLFHSILNFDPNATVVGPKAVYGYNIVMTAMQANGDIVHEDNERSMKVSLNAATLRGAVRDAYLAMDSGSAWHATGDSRVVLVGGMYASQIDADEGVVITAEAGEGCTLAGSYKLASGGVLTVAA